MNGRTATDFSGIAVAAALGAVTVVKGVWAVLGRDIQRRSTANPATTNPMIEAEMITARLGDRAATNGVEVVMRAAAGARIATRTAATSFCIALAVSPSLASSH